MQVDPARLHDNGVTLEQIVKTAGEAVWASPLTYLNSSTPGTGGFIDTPNQRLNVRHVFPITAAADFAKIPVFGTSLALRDVADVVEAHQPLIGDAILKDGAGPAARGREVPRLQHRGGNPRVEAALAELRPGLTGIDIDTTIYRPASFIERATEQPVHRDRSSPPSSRSSHSPRCWAAGARRWWRRASIALSLLAAAWCFTCAASTST